MQSQKILIIGNNQILLKYIFFLKIIQSVMKLILQFIMYNEQLNLTKPSVKKNYFK